MTPPDAARRSSASSRIEVAPAALLQNWRSAWTRARAYLRALGEEDDAGGARRIVEATAGRDPWPADAEAHAATLDGLRREHVRAGAEVPAAALEERFLEWRLRRATGRERVPPGRPDLARGRIPPHHIGRRGIRRRLISARTADPWNVPPSLAASPGPRAARARLLRKRWIWSAFLRRAFLLTLVAIPTVIASGFMIEVLPEQGRTLLEVAIVVVFGVLFGWISIGFWTAIAGFVVLLARRDRFRVTALTEGESEPIDPRVRIAILMTIREEPVEEVFARLRTLERSLATTGMLAQFDFHVLSDSHDPGTWAREEEAWLDWCREVDGFERIFYRKRRVHVKRKSGNIADFLRRYGPRYRYMVTLDADSLMSGESVVALVRIMEEQPAIGLVQTLPLPIHSRSLYGRIQQFANRVYGPLFATGMHFWQLGDAQYWGHNAILRVSPFMEHCSLPRLPGKPPRGGEILSHDFVEAAMLGRAGFSVWLAYDLGGSYEEIPSSLLEDLQRDRRWCQGNFQHLRLVWLEGLFRFHRALFVNGVLAYGSALLWFLFLSLSTAEAILQAVTVPEYFTEEPSLFPQWPVWRPDWAYSLLYVTLAILFLPKILSAVVVLTRGDGARAYGGVLRFAASIVLEFLASALFAPIRMVFHTKFVLTNVFGMVVAWRSPPRGVSETPWSEAIRHHAGATLLATAWGLGVYWLNPDYFWWLTPILGALVLSIPVSVWMSRLRLGDATRAAGLFATPEETAPPTEVALLGERAAAANAKLETLPAAERDGFVRVIVDPLLNALHVRELRGPRQLRASIREARLRLVERALTLGPAALGTTERKRLLVDRDCVLALHRSVWALADPELARLWGRPGLPPSVDEP